MRVTAEDLSRTLRFIEDAVEKNAPLNKTLERELRASSRRRMPNELFSNIASAMRSLLTPSTKGRGIFLVVTGVDRTGKETQCFNPEKYPGVTSIQDHLAENGFQTIPIALPSYNTLLGSLVAAYLNVPGQRVTIEGELPKDTAWMLWGLDRAQHNGEVQEWLRAERNVVLSRRWMESNIAYQMANGIDSQRLLRFEHNIIKQDYTIVLDAPVSPLLNRIDLSDEKPDKYEREDFMEEVRQNYLNLPRYYPFGQFVRINGMDSPQAVNAQILHALGRVLVG